MEKIMIALNTPLQAFDALLDLKEAVTRLEAKLVKQDSSGLHLDVSKIGTDKAWQSKSPIKKVFIPLHKVDHFIVLE